MTINDLVKKHGSLEEVIRKFLQGELDGPSNLLVQDKFNPVSIAWVSHRMVMETLKKQEELIWALINRK